MNSITPDPDALDPEFPEHAQAGPDTISDDPQETRDADDDDAKFASDDDDSDDDAEKEDEVEKD
jgi:hypothetical protein